MLPCDSITTPLKTAEKRWVINLTLPLDLYLPIGEEPYFWIWDIHMVEGFHHCT
jgi:hypothetical protein